LDDLGRSLSKSAANYHTECTVNCVIVCLMYVGRPWILIREENAVTMNKDCHDVGLRKQHLRYHKS